MHLSILGVLVQSSSVFMSLHVLPDLQLSLRVQLYYNYYLLYFFLSIGHLLLPQCITIP